MGEIRIKSRNLVESVTVSTNQALYGVPLFLEADLKPDTEYTFAFKLTEGYYVYWNEFLFTNNTPLITGAGDTTIVVTKRTRSDLSKNDLRQYDNSKGGWIIHKNRKEEDSPASYNNVQILEGTYTSETIPEYQPYFLNRPAHQFTNGEWIDIPTHKYTNNRWQGELTSQSPLKFRADGEMLDWRIEGASGGVGNWDETAQKYRIPVTVRGSNLYSSAWEQGFWNYDTGVSWGTDSKYVRTAKMSCKGNTKYEFVCSLPDGSKNYGFVFWDTNGNYIGNINSSDVQNTPVKYSVTSPANAKMMAVNIARYSGGERYPADILSFDLYEQYEVNLFTDHQLLDGDSIDYTTTETQIPLATGNNVLTVDTTVKPKSVFVKFEG